ncbi:hypothetical protein GIB67_015410 [Kingdonia uniflora]|uniref:Transmembrane protein n=1 Tax=Kingdonia uniflora TaxID=39325 RepID=A0A7J7KYZ6_9MAGN|nr:hypothetical protein GIB67_015410 [Kingdonia uniflora]
MTAGAVSFYRDRTTKNARRMFHASLLYLPVFMSGLLFHRITDNDEQLLTETSLDNIMEIESLKERKSERMKPRAPPVAYASVAPFPFLPVPVYASDL